MHRRGSRLQLATLLVLNQASYEVRESEAQALFGLSRAEIETERSRRSAAPRGAHPDPHVPRAQRPLLWLMDPPAGAGRGSPGRIHAPLLRMPAVGMLQFGFSKPCRWLPRDLALLGAAAARCREALEYRRMEAAKREAEENERRRIGRELHDEAGQSLLVLRLELEMMERRAPEALAAAAAGRAGDRREDGGRAAADRGGVESGGAGAARSRGRAAAAGRRGSSGPMPSR